jgi:hypothetical protein
MGKDTSDEHRLPSQAVRVVDIRIRFESLVWLFVKAAFAAIPAAIIVGSVGVIAASLLGLL